MTESLDVYLYESLAARVDKRRGSYRLTYTAEWQREGGPSLSLSLPVAQRNHSGRVVSDFLDNLLPDSATVREQWARQAGLSEADPFQLLAIHGRDVAGALEFYTEGEPRSVSGSITPVSEDAIASRIRAIRDDRAIPLADNAANGQFSLGGAQGKFAVALHGGEWFDPTGAQPSTHIFKPKVAGFDDGEIVEHITMTAMPILGLPAAESAIVEFGGEHTLVVKRFDREERADGLVHRVHQEDMAQALGIPRLKKYELNGGPSYRDILGVLDRIDDRDTAALAKERFVKSLMYSWMVLNTDAHSKNYSLRRLPESFDLTDMYDVSSFVPYARPSDSSLDALQTAFDETTLSMKIAGNYASGSMGAFEWASVARDAGLKPEEFLDWGILRAEAVSPVFRAVAETLPEKYQTSVVELLLERMDERSNQVQARLRRPIHV